MATQSNSLFSMNLLNSEIHYSSEVGSFTNSPNSLDIIFFTTELNYDVARDLEKGNTS